MVYAIIVAGGSGSRFGGPRRKQYLELAGVPVLVRTLRTFDACAAVGALVAVVPAEDLDFARDKLLSAARLEKPLRLCRGGKDRQESVFNGLASIPGGDSLVVVHDAVRPLVSGECIRACIAAARAEGAGIAAVPARDTLKQADGDGIITGTLPRRGVWLAQTPQAFQAGLLRAAHAAARSQGYTGTDDAALVERIGGRIRIVPGSPRNLKITTPDDLALAEALLAAEAAG